MSDFIFRHRHKRIASLGSPGARRGIALKAGHPVPKVGKTDTKIQEGASRQDNRADNVRAERKLGWFPKFIYVLIKVRGFFGAICQD
jgi:hypothetical protein